MHPQDVWWQHPIATALMGFLPLLCVAAHATDASSVLRHAQRHTTYRDHPPERVPEVGQREQELHEDFVRWRR